MSYLYGIALQDKPYSQIKNSKSYSYWKNMIKRCYDKKFHLKRPTYKSCTVCKEWLKFSNFEKWFDENYYEINGEKICLDKDILIKNNKIYSPQTCVFVPNQLNTLFLKPKNNNDCTPIGVCCVKGKYRATCSVKGKNILIGTYETMQEAQEMYNDYKNNYVITVLQYYENIIPNKIYKNIKQSICERIKHNEF